MLFSCLCYTYACKRKTLKDIPAQRILTTRDASRLAEALDISGVFGDLDSAGFPPFEETVLNSIDGVEAKAIKLEDKESEVAKHASSLDEFQTAVLITRGPTSEKVLIGINHDGLSLDEIADKVPDAVNEIFHSPDI